MRTCGKDPTNNMWQKTRSIWGYIYDNYMDDYDFFWLGGDDYYMIVENMVNYLATLDQSQALARTIQAHRGKKVSYGAGNFKCRQLPPTLCRQRLVSPQMLLLFTTFCKF